MLAQLHHVPRSEDELRAALSAACHGKFRMCVPAQADDHDMVLSDGITELMFARAEIARLRRDLARVLDDYAQECASEWSMTRAKFDAHIAALLAGTDAGA